MKLIEERQMALAAALASENIDKSTLRRLGFYPPRRARPAAVARSTATRPIRRSSSFSPAGRSSTILQSGAIAVPSDKPVKTAAFTSGYGVRSDPFRGGAAMHAGIDLAGPHGTPIYATADGTVTNAGWNSGGYGNLIKVDHGRGIETRYGHLVANARP